MVPGLPPLAAEIERLKKELAKRDAEIERLQLENDNLRAMLMSEVQSGSREPISAAELSLGVLDTIVV